MPDPHRYRAALRWIGSTGAGWDAYAREHVASAPPAAQEVGLTTGEAQGDPSVLNPEQLLVMAASSCQMLWFLHLAAKARVDVVQYEDDAEGVMPAGREPTRVTEIALRPRIVVASDTGEDRVRKLLATAHDHCYIANSLNASITIEPAIELRAAAS